ncbi:MAG: phosphate-starvation-inducible PsiE family protein [Pseudomonadota bacterium]|jgi:protein PsiE
MQQGALQGKVKFVFRLVEQSALVIIGIATIIAAGQDLLRMFQQHAVTLGDLLLMFLYLEVLAMVSFYYASGKLPVTYPLYIGIVALARYIVLDMKELDPTHMLATAGAIFILAVAVLLVRYGHLRFPYPEDEPN